MDHLAAEAVPQTPHEPQPICSKLYEDFTRRKRQRGGMCECGHMVMYHKRENETWLQTPTAELLGGDSSTARGYVEASLICGRAYEDFADWQRDNGGMCECGHLVQHHQRPSQVITPTAQPLAGATAAHVRVETALICAKLFEDFARRKREKGGICECGHLVRNHERGEQPPLQLTPMAQLFADASEVLDCLRIRRMFALEGVDEKKQS